ncbi:MAG: urease accessory protein UreE, partial [Burkholderiales bacterium]|nr:urease accessory protein UreE [Burkholderiales bacterium]
EGYLRLAADHVLAEMLKKLGARVEEVEAPFEPEPGAYAAGHRHDEMGHGGKIHDHFGEPHGDRGHAHDRAHPHDQARCDHPEHRHGHGH